MSRRNPMNQRYQKDVTGKTRRSAASAKPKRAHGERVTEKTTPKAKKKTGIVESGKKRSGRKLFEPLETTAEMKRWRKIWWGYILGSLTLIAGSALTRDSEIVIGKMDLSVIFVTLAYAAIFTALYIDFTKIRRLRKEALEANRKKDSKKDSKKESEKSSKKDSAKESQKDSKKGSNKQAGDAEGAPASKDQKKK